MLLAANDIAMSYSKKIVLMGLASLGLILPAQSSLADTVVAEQVNYCEDPDIGQHWQQRLQDFPDDPLVQKLYALRQGLCVMVTDGTMELSAAARLFETEQGRSVIERMQDEAQENPYRSL